MSIRIRALGALAGMFAFATIMGSAQAADRPYTEGTVSVVSSIRTEPGQHENYLKYLATTYRQIMDEQKKAGHIVDWSVFETRSRAPVMSRARAKRALFFSTRIPHPSPLPRAVTRPLADLSH